MRMKSLFAEETDAPSAVLRLRPQRIDGATVKKKKQKTLYKDLEIFALPDLYLLGIRKLHEVFLSPRRSGANIVAAYLRHGTWLKARILGQDI